MRIRLTSRGASCYSDWLEEQGDPRAQLVRNQCLFRAPIQDCEIRRFAILDEARRSATSDDVVIDVNLNVPGPPIASGETGISRLRDDVDALNRGEIARNFPRDDRGKLALGECILLNRYESAEPVRGSRHIWLIARGPARRQDPQQVTVCLTELISENHRHNWSLRRAWWDRHFSGSDPLSADFISSIHRAQWMSTPRQAEKMSENERIVLSTAMLDEGRFEDALRVCDVGFSPDLTRVLNGEEFQIEGGCDHNDSDGAVLRAARLRRELWESAPWNFVSAVSQMWELQREWRGARRIKRVNLRLFVLPKAFHARKPCLMLGLNSTGRANLSFEFTGTNVYLPECLWKRSVQIDITRFRPQESGTPA